MVPYLGAPGIAPGFRPYPLHKRYFAPGLRSLRFRE